MLRAVLFDLDNTLIDRDAAFMRCVRRQFRKAWVREELLKLDDGGYGNRETMFLAWQRHSGRPMNQKLFGQMISARIKPNIALLKVLENLSMKFKLGIITNGSGTTQRRKWAAAGLSKSIPICRVWISEEVGMAKPDRGIFKLACRTLKEATENCLYVGDHEEDVRGAKEIGMRTRVVSQVLAARQLTNLIVEEGAQ